MPYAKLNASGCEIRKEKIKLRLDLFLNPADPNYDKHHRYVVDWDSSEAQAGYSGEVDADGNPVDLNDYQQWEDSLPHIWVDTPFHVHFIHPLHTASDAEILSDITRCLGYFYAFKQHCWDSELRFIDEWKKVAFQDGEIRHRFVAGKPKDKKKNADRLQDLLSRISEFDVDISAPSGETDLRIGEHGTIDIGDTAEDMSSSSILYTGGSYYTRATQKNPANATGTIDTVEVYVPTPQAGNSVRFGIFEHLGSNELLCRDAEEAGGCSPGYNEFTGLSIDVATGDYIGADTPNNKVLQLDSEVATGEDVWWISGQYCVIDSQQTYTVATDTRYAIGGTGTESAAPTELELRSATDTAARLALNTGITLALRAASDTEARLTISVAISIAGRAYSNTRAAIALDTLTAIEPRSLTDTRAALTLTVTEVTELELRSFTETRAALAISVTAVTELSCRSSTDTRADIDLDTLIELAFKSLTDTRAAITLDTAIPLSLRSVSDTRASLILDTLVSLALRSLTDTRAALEIQVTEITYLECRSATGTKASLALASLIALELRSSTSTRAAIILTISLLTEIQCRSATATRAAIQLNSLITLALLSQTSTRAALSLTTAMRQQTLNMELHDRELTMAMRGDQQ